MYAIAHIPLFLYVTVHIPLFRSTLSINPFDINLAQATPILGTAAHLSHNPSYLPYSCRSHVVVFIVVCSTLSHPSTFLRLFTLCSPAFPCTFHCHLPALCGALAGCILFGVLYLTKWDAAERKVSLASRHEEVQLIKDVIMRRKELHEKGLDGGNGILSTKSQVIPLPCTHVILPFPLTPLDLTI